MKFTWKMIVAVTILLALALSLGSYLLVSDAFSAQLDAAIEDSQKELRMFTLTVQALVVGQSVFSFQKQPDELLQSILREGRRKADLPDQRYRTAANGRLRRQHGNDCRP